MLTLSLFPPTLAPPAIIDQILSKSGQISKRITIFSIFFNYSFPLLVYKERERARDVLVASYVSSYDVSSNPSVVEGESMQSVKKNSRTLVEEW